MMRLCAASVEMAIVLVGKKNGQRQMEVRGISGKCSSLGDGRGRKADFSTSLLAKARAASVEMTIDFARVERETTANTAPLG